MIEWEVVRWIVGVLWVPFVPFLLAKRNEYAQEKKELQQRVSQLEKDFAVLEETAVTEVSLRDYISTRFEKAEQAQKEELRRLEQKIDTLASTIGQVLPHLPKRKGEG